MKRGLILEGGAMRGMFSAGVIDVMMENHIAFDGLIGVSAGAAFGCNYKSWQIGRVLRYNTAYCRDKRYCGLRVLYKTGDIYSREFCYGEVPLRLDPFDFAAFKRNPMEFYVVCTDVDTGGAVYHRYEGLEDHGFDWIRASASMPFVSQIVDIDGQKLLDGGVADAVPLRFFQSLGYDTNVAVLTRPRGYRRKKNGFLPLMRRRYRACPRFVEALEQQHIRYNETLAHIEAEEDAGRLFVIRPERPLELKRVERNPDRLRAAYECGRATAYGRMEALRGFLGL